MNQKVNLKREYLERALTVVTNFTKSVPVDVIYIVNKNRVLTLQLNSQATAACIPLDSSEYTEDDYVISLSLSDLQTAVSVLDRDSDLMLDLDDDEGKIKITDDEGGEFNVIALNGIPFVEKKVSERIVIVQNVAAFMDIVNRCSIFLPSDSGKNNFIFIRPDGYAVLFDEEKVVQLQGKSITVKTEETVAIPYRLAMTVLKNYVPTSVNVSIVKQEEGENKYVAIKFSDNYWLRVGDYFTDYESVEMILQKLSEMNFQYSVTLPNVSFAIRNFSQLSKFIQKEENPYVLISIDKDSMEAAATPIKLDGVLSKRFTISSNVDSTMKFFINPKLVLSALGILRGSQSANILLSDNQDDPIGIIPGETIESDCFVFIKKVKLA